MSTYDRAWALFAIVGCAFSIHFGAYSLAAVYALLAICMCIDGSAS
jgi:hypothetical protein